MEKFEEFSFYGLPQQRLRPCNSRITMEEPVVVEETHSEGIPREAARAWGDPSADAGPDRAIPAQLQMVGGGERQGVGSGRPGEKVFYNSAKAKRTCLGRLHYCAACPGWNKVRTDAEGMVAWGGAAG